MNIKQAKEEIKNTVKAYLTKDAYGQYVIPISRQRPVFLLGAPGIGKTAIMEQIAQELGISMVSYSMTHHTRQSALGLPFIVKKAYGEMECNVTEYTMSEIIATIHDVMEESGIRQGILFLDEINCVSETLSSTMLEFLQYKRFGKHHVPEGWIVVTAGNPPEFNNSVHEYDIATWDRLKKINVEPDFNVWKEYAYSRGVHVAIINYLEMKPDKFYEIESTPEGKRFVTARGWEDLSDMIKLYEQNEIPVDNTLISQYVQHSKIARDFANYLILFQKYKADYKVEQILAGKFPAQTKDMVAKAGFDERLSLVGLLLDSCDTKCKDVMEQNQVLKEAFNAFVAIKDELARNIPASQAIDNAINRNNERIRIGKASNSMSKNDMNILMRCNTCLEETLPDMQGTSAESFKALKKAFASLKKNTATAAGKVNKILANLFAFADNVVQDDRMTSIIVSEMTVRVNVSSFVTHYGCPEYYAHNKKLLFYEREKELKDMIETLDLGDLDNETPSDH